MFGTAAYLHTMKSVLIFFGTFTSRKSNFSILRPFSYFTKILSSCICFCSFLSNGTVHKWRPVMQTNSWEMWSKYFFGNVAVNFFCEEDRTLKNPNLLWGHLWTFRMVSQYKKIIDLIINFSLIRFLSRQSQL